MSRRIDSLWDGLELPGAPFEADAANILARVNGALNAAPEERKGYMKYKLRCAALAAAAALLLAGSALAAVSNWDALSVFFMGDTSPAQEYLQTPNLSVSDGAFTVTLESSVTDGQNAFVIVTVTALTEEAEARMAEQYFVDMDTFDFRTVSHDGTLGSGALYLGPINARATENSQSFSLQLMGIPSDTKRVYLKFGFLPKEMTLDVPLDRCAGAVEAAADFAAQDREGRTYFFTRATLSPLTFQFRYRNPADNGLLDPVYFFLMKDGSIQTKSQLLTHNESDSGLNGTRNAIERYTFKTVQTISDFRAIIVGGRAFPFDGGEPFDVEVDSKLSPFIMPHLGGIDGAGPYFISVRALCETLGGVCVWDDATQSAALTYRDVTIVLTLGNGTAQVDGESVVLDYPPDLRGGNMALVPTIFDRYWGIYADLEYDRETEAYSQWIILP